AGHTSGGRPLVFARKPAPLQIAWLDYFDTTGLATMDYLVTDAVHTPPGSSQRFVESLIRLPETRLCFSPPAATPDPGPSPASRRPGLTFASFNRCGKISDGALSLWARLLRALPDSTLVLKAGELCDPALVEQARQRCADIGIDVSRLELRGPSPYLDM